MGTRRQCRHALTFASMVTLSACSSSPSGNECPTVTARAPLPLPPVLASTALPAPSAAPKPTSEPDETAEDLYCRKNEKERFGAWEATPAEVRAALDKVEFVCAPQDWLAVAVLDCMQRMGQTAVVVRFGVFGGERWTPNACDVAVQTAEWKGRKWVTLACDIREGHTFFGYVTAMESTPKGPVTSSRGCARDAKGTIMGAHLHLEPKGWSSFPEELRSRLCL